MTDYAKGRADALVILNRHLQKHIKLERCAASTDKQRFSRDVIVEIGGMIDEIEALAQQTQPSPLGPVYESYFQCKNCGHKSDTVYRYDHHMAQQPQPEPKRECGTCDFWRGGECWALDDPSRECINAGAGYARWQPKGGA